jgi:hypothetical protein
VDGSHPDGTFSPIKVYAGSSSFIPSTGGIYVDFNGKVYPWGAYYTLVGTRLDKDPDNNNGTVVTEWLMVQNGQTCYYMYTMRIEGQTLIVHVEVLSNKDHVLGIIFQNCSGVANPRAVSVPYLPFFHILRANSEYTSFFADWEKSDASDIEAYDLSDTHYSDGSFYSQLINYGQLTDYSRNILNETLYLTTSPIIEDVFPNTANPVSTKKNESANSILWDYRSPYYWLISMPDYPTRQGDMQQIYNAGLTNIWLQIHNWQRFGYDNGYPYVTPAYDGKWHYAPLNPPASYGPDQIITVLNQIQPKYVSLVGLHQNYVDYYPDAGPIGDYVYDINNTAKDMYWQPVNAHKSTLGGQSYLLKPTKAPEFAAYWANKIHTTYPSVNASYLDQHSSVLPFQDRVDFEKEVSGSGKFRTTMQNYRAVLDTLRYINNGPVQGEGGNQPFYQGYADDMDARLILPTNQYFNGKNFPVFVDFDIRKLRPKAFVHGVGYYPCFYKPSEDDDSKINQQIVLEYIATELAYGHGSYLPTPDLTAGYTTGNNYDFSEFIGYAQLENKHVYSMRNTFLNATVLRISYSDNGNGDANLQSASDYISTHPD